MKNKNFSDIFSIKSDTASKLTLDKMAALLDADFAIDEFEIRFRQKMLEALAIGFFEEENEVQS